MLEVRDLGALDAVAISVVAFGVAALSEVAFCTQTKLPVSFFQLIRYTEN